jgi:hypothetical protein
MQMSGMVLRTKKSRSGNYRFWQLLVKKKIPGISPPVAIPSVAIVARLRNSALYLVAGAFMGQKVLALMKYIIFSLL